MAESSVDGLIDAVAPGDIVALDHGGVERAYKVVHKEEADSGYLITFEGDDGETFQLQVPTGAPVKRSLESKWESAQSPTPHSP
jgi:hypothetical protein